ILSTYCIVNCSFYFKIGACRHGDKCSRIHNRPTFSQTILLQNLYQNPKMDIHRSEAALLSDVGVTDAQEQQHFDEFFEEIFTEIEDKYGEIEEMNVCDNIGEHMIGNVYIKFKREEDAEKAVKDLNTRWFGGMPIYAELSPVTDFREACCRQYEMGECMRGGFCNFMHLKPISYELKRELFNRDHPWRHRRHRKRKKKKKPKDYCSPILAGEKNFRPDRFERRKSRSRSRDRDRRGRY
ncbi:unnamed protein product, partial [Soboliphyme baturini]|uniref:U2AF1 factor n=1 Tax=Soboliphyme baturini TaxID=241478 RepID=A0A183IP09_9BILA